MYMNHTHHSPIKNLTLLCCLSKLTRRYCTPLLSSKEYCIYSICFKRLRSNISKTLHVSSINGTVVPLQVSVNIDLGVLLDLDSSLMETVIKSHSSFWRPLDRNSRD